MLLFGLCLMNRFLSGASEAAASGADESIAYDALPEENRVQAWDVVLGTAMRWRSAGFLVAMTLGGLLYDPSWFNRLVPDSMQLSLDTAHRLPLLVVFIQAIACLGIALRFEETRPHRHARGTLAAATRLTLRTAHRAFTTKAIAIVLLGGVMIDAIARNVATLNSEYYRLIHIPEWLFGVIGSLIAVGNWFVPGMAKRANELGSPLQVLCASGAIAAAALLLMVPAWPWIGLLPTMVLMMMLGFVSFTVGRFLHSQAESHERATLLSVKGLTFNLGYGLASLAFSGVLALQKQQGDGYFQRALLWQGVGFLLVLLAFSMIARLRKSTDNR